jgi:hypothetical protein
MGAIQMKTLIIGIITSLVVAGSTLAEDFHLSCGGQGSRVAASTTYGEATDNYGDFVTGSATTYYKATAPDRLLIEIDDNVQRIRVPATIIPPLHAGGRDGWWILKNVKVTDDEISGQFELNFVNQPTFHVDRRTGDISLQGFRNGFTGICEKFDPAPEARKF